VPVTQYLIVLRESTFIMPRVGWGGAPKYFLALKGGALKILDILKGRGGVQTFQSFQSQGPGVFTPAP
jgi:hypothetical protein